jgi:hypothetical protein
MPKGDNETTAVRLAKENWRIYAGCECVPREVPEGKGYDLGCTHRHVEVKGTGHTHPGFRLLTVGEFDAARRDPLFELWLITGIEKGSGTFHILARDEVLSAAKLTIQWNVPLGKKRLEQFREKAVERESKKGQR